MASPLTIRNLTSTQTELKLVERYEDPQQSVSNGTSMNYLTRNFTVLMSNITSPSSTQLASKAETFTRHDISVPVAPFEIEKTDIQPKPGEVLRLTFETEGERYRLDVPTPSQKSVVLKPLSPNPRFEYTAVYLPQCSYLALYSSAKSESWMWKLKDEAPLSALSIPGTHNSPTCYPALPSVRCQAVGITEQLSNGIRFLDIRVQPDNPEDLSKDSLVLVHSIFPISLTGKKYFRDLVKDVTTFLDRNPSETIVMSLKREGAGKATDQQLSKILHSHYINDPSRWYTQDRIPTLGEVRKKIVVIRRFWLDDSLKAENNGTGWCINAESWPDNCADGTCSSGEIRVQDFYEVMESKTIEKKITYSTDHLERSAQCVCLLPDDTKAAVTAAAKQPFWMNFLSASNFFSPACWPDKIAVKVNPSIVDYLCQLHNVDDGQKKVGDGSTGIVVCDWVGNNGDWDLVRCIVGHNSRLEMR